MLQSLFSLVLVATTPITFDTDLAHHESFSCVLDLTSGDWDSDGILDLVAANFSCRLPETPSLFLLRGTGTGQFSDHEEILPTEAEITLVKAGDVDGDGKLDLVSASCATGLLHVLLGDGSGAFQETTIATGMSPTSMVLADLNRDGNLDAAVVFRTGQQVRILLGDGTGTFVSFVNRFPGEDAADIAVGDLTGDGVLDLVTINPAESNVRVMAGNGSGDFSFRGIIAVPGRGRPSRLALGDLDEDGALDIVTSLGMRQDIHLMYGDGAGGAREILTVASILDGDWFLGDPTLLVDLNRDSHLDLVSSSDLAHGDGSGNFERPPGARAAGCSGFTGYPARIEIGDFNGDGRLDRATNSIGVMLSLGDGTSPAPVPASFRSGSFLEDFNADGFPDLGWVRELQSHVDSGAVEVSLGRGDGEFDLPIYLGYCCLSEYTGHTIAAPKAVAVGDYDEDGRKDLVVSDLYGCRLQIFAGEDSADVFGQSAVFEMEDVFPFEVFTRAIELRSHDLNHDGHLDLLLWDRTYRGLLSFLGDGTGTLVESMSVEDFADSGYSATLCVADFNEDNFPDLLARYESEPVIYWGDGVGGFSPPASIPLAPAGAALRPADLDLDGHVDLLAGAATGLTPLFGFGDGTFELRNLPPNPVAYPGLLEDLNGDQIPDLVSWAHVFVGDGAGGFEFSLSLPFAPLPRVSGDIDRDGLFDLVGDGCVAFNRSGRHFECRAGTVNAGSGPITDVVFVNDSSGSGRERTVPVTPTTPFSLRVDAPPLAAGAEARFVLYLALGNPGPLSERNLPSGLGRLCVGSPLTRERSFRTVNNLGFSRILGRERWPGPPTSPAPVTLVDLAGGLRRSGTFVFQGLIEDSDSPLGVSTTNAVVVVSE